MHNKNKKDYKQSQKSQGEIAAELALIKYKTERLKTICIVSAFICMTFVMCFMIGAYFVNIPTIETEHYSVKSGDGDIANSNINVGTGNTLWQK